MLEREGIPEKHSQWTDSQSSLPVHFIVASLYFSPV